MLETVQARDTDYEKLLVKIGSGAMSCSYWDNQLKDAMELLVATPYKEAALAAFEQAMAPQADDLPLKYSEKARMAITIAHATQDAELRAAALSAVRTLLHDDYAKRLDDGAYGAYGVGLVGHIYHYLASDLELRQLGVEALMTYAKDPAATPLQSAHALQFLVWVAEPEYAVAILDIIAARQLLPHVSASFSAYNVEDSKRESDLVQSLLKLTAVSCTDKLAFFNKARDEQGAYQHAFAPTTPYYSCYSQEQCELVYDYCVGYRDTVGRIMSEEVIHPQAVQDTLVVLDTLMANLTDPAGVLTAECGYTTELVKTPTAMEVYWRQFAPLTALINETVQPTLRQETLVDIRNLMFGGTVSHELRGEYAYVLRMAPGDSSLQAIGYEAHILYTNDPATTATQRQGHIWSAFSDQQRQQAGLDVMKARQSVPAETILVDPLAWLEPQLQAVKTALPQLNCEARLTLHQELQAYYQEYFVGGTLAERCDEDDHDWCMDHIQDNAAEVRATLAELGDPAGLMVTECGYGVA